MSDPSTKEPITPEPLLRIVKGDPRPEEVAALVAVVSALASAGPAEGERPRPSEWAAPRRRLRTALHHGPDAWRNSAR